MEYESDILIYQTEDGHTKIDVRLEDENGLDDTEGDCGALSKRC
ncbi:hypothetical protein ACKXGF_14105 [Alkalibacillus sp. S2W]